MIHIHGWAFDVTEGNQFGVSSTRQVGLVEVDTFLQTNLCRPCFDGPNTCWSPLPCTLQPVQSQVEGPTGVPRGTRPVCVTIANLCTGV